MISNIRKTKRRIFYQICIFIIKVYTWHSIIIFSIPGGVCSFLDIILTVNDVLLVSFHYFNHWTPMLNSSMGQSRFHEPEALHMRSHKSIHTKVILSFKFTAGCIATISYMIWIHFQVFTKAQENIWIVFLKTCKWNIRQLWANLNM